MPELSGKVCLPRLDVTLTADFELPVWVKHPFWSGSFVVKNDIIATKMSLASMPACVVGTLYMGHGTLQHCEPETTDGHCQYGDLPNYSRLPVRHSRTFAEGDRLEWNRLDVDGSSPEYQRAWIGSFASAFGSLRRTGHW